MTYEEFRQFLYDETSRIEEGEVTNAQAFLHVADAVNKVNATEEKDR